MSYVFPPAAQASVPVAGGEQSFPVHRIYCVGRNYADHAKEMGFSERESPFFFMKPADAVLPVAQGQIGRMPYPDETGNLHHEIELVVAIGRAGRRIDADRALDHVCGYAVGLDMTRRDLQATLRDNGRPWDVAKGFDHSAPIAPIHRKEHVANIERARVWLNVNGEKRQDGNVEQLIWNIGETIAALSRYFELRPGDLVFTGTPAGVGAVERGDRLEGGVDGLTSLTVELV